MLWVVYNENNKNMSETSFLSCFSTSIQFPECNSLISGDVLKVEHWKHCACLFFSNGLSSLKLWKKWKTSFSWMSVVMMWIINGQKVCNLKNMEYRTYQDKRKHNLSNEEGFHWRVHQRWSIIALKNDKNNNYPWILKNGVAVKWWRNLVSSLWKELARVCAKPHWKSKTRKLRNLNMSDICTCVEYEELLALNSRDSMEKEKSKRGGKKEKEKAVTHMLS